MNVVKPGADRHRLKLRVLSNEELWWFFLDHPQQCLQEFWNEVEARKAAGILIQRQSILEDGQSRALPSTATLRWETIQPH